MAPQARSDFAVPWCASRGGGADAKVIAGHVVCQLDFADGDVVAEGAATLQGATCTELTTKADGACAIHAVFGAYLPSTQEIEHANPRLLAQEVLDQPLDEIRKGVRLEMRHLVEYVLTTLWSEFVVPYVQSGHILF